MKKSNAMRLLEQAGIEYEAFEYDGEGGKISGAEIAARIGMPPNLVCKTLVTATDHREYFVFVIPVEKTLDLKAAARAAGVKSLAMLPLAKLFPLTGYVHGGCSPVGMKKPFPTVFRETVILFDTIYVSAGKIGAQVEADPNALMALIGAGAADVTVE